MHYIPLLVILALAAFPLHASARGAVVFVVDALGSSYLAPNTATYSSTGAAIDPIRLRSFDRADARYQLKVPVPATEYGHAVIVTGYSGASEKTVAFYRSTIFDALKDDGYLTLGIMENGDTQEMIGKLDAIVHNKNESVLAPDFEFEENNRTIPPDIARMMGEYPHALPATNARDAYGSYIGYNAWGINFTRDLVDYMDKRHPGQNYILIVNIGGLDSVGQSLGYGGYRAVLTGMDKDMDGLVDACKKSGTILLVTGDHGMSFKNEASRGAHQSSDASYRRESLLTPLFIYSNATMAGGGTFGQECLAPTLLSLLDEPNTMSMCNGEPLPVKDRPTLYLRSTSPVDVTVTGNGLNVAIRANGTYRLEGLEKGNYTVRYGGIEKSVILAHDEVMDVREDAPGAPSGTPWIVYLVVAGISGAGICIALKLACARR